MRPGRKTAEYVTRTLTNMSVLGSVFLGALAAAPAAVRAAPPPPVPCAYPHETWCTPHIDVPEANLAALGLARFGPLILFGAIQPPLEWDQLTCC